MYKRQEHDDARARLGRKLHHGEAYGPCADDEDRLVALDAGPLDGMAADGERLDERKLIEGQGRRRVQLPSRHRELLAHAAVDMDPEHAEVGAAVGFP